MGTTTKSKTKASTTDKPAGVPVVVTTEHRGIFFGYADPNELTADVINLAQARNCVIAKPYLAAQRYCGLRWRDTCALYPEKSQEQVDAWLEWLAAAGHTF